MFSSSTLSVTLVQYVTLFLTVLGLFFFDFTFQEYLLILLGYFLYSGVGISMTLHRHLTHKSFDFSNRFVKWVCIWFALMAGRGGIIGWVYTHRLHHAYSDTDKDPHTPNFSLRGMFFPSYKHLNQKINFRLVKDLLSENYQKLDKYYNILLLAWVGMLFLISPELLYFFWIVPVALTHIVLNSFIYLGHMAGYTNHAYRDASKNLWPYSILFWGEGWHNNHHKNPQSFTMRDRWWEIDLIEPVIRLVKK